MRYRLAPAVAYLGLMALWIYGVVNRWDPGSGAWQLPVLVVVVFVSMPAGDPPITPDYAEPLPIWFGLAFAAPVGCLLIAIGVAVRKILDRRPNWGFGAQAT